MIGFVVLFVGSTVFIFFVGLDSGDEVDPEGASARSTPLVDRVLEGVATPEPTDEVELAQVGEPVSFANWTYRISDVELHDTIGDEVARGKFVALLVEATNGGDRPRQLGDLGLVIVTSTGNQYNMDGAASLAHHHTYGVDTWHYEDVGPGFSATVPVVFDVPLEVDGLVFVTQSRGSGVHSDGVAVFLDEFT